VEGGLSSYEEVKEKEEAALEKAMVDLAKINLNAPLIAQDIFDILSYTLPCRWEEQQQESQGGKSEEGQMVKIVVNEQFVVQSPFSIPRDVIPIDPSSTPSSAQERITKLVLKNSDT